MSAIYRKNEVTGLPTRQTCLAGIHNIPWKRILMVWRGGKGVRRAICEDLLIGLVFPNRSVVYYVILRVYSDRFEDV